MKINPLKLFHDFVSSFAGCSSGNVNSPVWICGLEQGGGFLEDEYITEKWLREGVREFEDMHTNSAEAFMQNFFASKSPFCHGVLRALAVLKFGKIPEDFQINTQWLESHGLIGSQGLALVLNAYPVTMKSRSYSNDAWDSEYKIQHEDGSKELFKDWVSLPYFWLYKKWTIAARKIPFIQVREKKAPKLIICTGSEEVYDFFELWGVNWMGAEIIPDPQNELQPVYLSFAQNKPGQNNTIVAVVPFFGYQKSTLNSYERYNRIINLLRERCINYFGENWLN